MAKPKQPVVAQFDWCAVKMATVEGYASYDMWEWNTYKMKWVRLANHGSGFGSLANAERCAKERSDEIQRMLDNNKNKPHPL